MFFWTHAGTLQYINSAFINLWRTCGLSLLLCTDHLLGFDKINGLFRRQSLPISEADGWFFLPDFLKLLFRELETITTFELLFEFNSSNSYNLLCITGPAKLLKTASSETIFFEEMNFSSITLIFDVKWFRFPCLLVCIQSVRCVFALGKAWEFWRNREGGTMIAFSAIKLR